jgi:hypothetical protein
MNGAMADDKGELCANKGDPLRQARPRSPPEWGAARAYARGQPWSAARLDQRHSRSSSVPVAAGSGESRLVSNIGVSDQQATGLQRTGKVSKAGTVLLPWLVLASLLMPSVAHSWRKEDHSIVIEDGDTLWGVASEHLGDGRKYDKLLEQCPPNRTLSSVNLIRPGLRLECAPPKTPENGSDQEVPPTHIEELASEISIHQQNVEKEIKAFRGDLQFLFCRRVDGTIPLPEGCANADSNIVVPAFLHALHDEQSKAAKALQKMSAHLAETAGQGTSFIDLAIDSIAFCIALILVGVMIKNIWQYQIFVEPILVPPKVSNRGYSGEALARSIKEKLNKIALEVARIESAPGARVWPKATRVWPKAKSRGVSVTYATPAPATVIMVSTHTDFG